MPLFNQQGYGSGRYGIQDYGPLYAMPVAYYLNLLTSEYRMSPLLNKWLAVEIAYMDATTTALQNMTTAFTLDYAVGVQLDILGQIVGGAAASRKVGFQPSNNVSPVLDDDTYRLLIRATIANNVWDGTHTTLYPLWEDLFPGGQLRIIDNQDMTCTVLLSGAFTGIVQDLIVNGYIVPRPEAVAYTYTFGNYPIFGFSRTENEVIAGFGKGNWSQ